ncbi:MAG: rod shape-determining protein MreC [Thermodesulfobacteriota bacterium]|nr:MAG: rod shape-determining protein MreC [Thermodesulfobacteriota bacterium]RLG12784.1 MAG: rod shape-determining protein MreC [Candidatus Pacearchaeota archaeon]
MRFKKSVIVLFIFIFVFICGVLYGIKGGNIFSELLGIFFSPVWKSGTYISDKFRKFFSDYLFLVNLKKENQRLKEEILFLKSQLNYYKEREKIYRKLEKFYKLSLPIKYPKIAARIIYRPLDPFSRVIFIDKGSKDGLSSQMPVLASAGGKAVALIGQVVEVHRTWSKVLLLTDPSFAADVKIQRTGDRGILKGKGGNMCFLDYLPSYADVKKGDIVITSGQDALFPPGLLIGHIVSVNKKLVQGLFKRAYVKPIVNIYNLDIVFILIKLPQIPL